MKVLLKLECGHTPLLKDHRGQPPVLHWCLQCHEISQVIDFITDRDQVGPDGKR